MSILNTERLRRRWSAATAVALVGGLLPLVGPSAAPARAASPTTTTLTVNKGGDRTGEQVVAPMPGATFDFYAGVSGTRPGPGDSPTASCTTDATGACSVDVPGRTGTNQGYWIIERSAPAGWQLIQTLDTGSVNSATTPTTYNGVFTGAVADNRSYTFPVVTTGNTNRTARGPYWADARDNPPLPPNCGLKIALLIDVSGSIAPSLNDVKGAANGFVDALTGTPSQIALYKFNNLAATVLNPTPVSDVSGANTVKTAINGLTAGGTTNWDAGLWEIAADAADYDAVIMLTDGNPTVYGPPPVQGPGNFTRFVEVENGVFSANAVKAQGTRIVAVGVGAGVTGSADNLAAISGPVAGSDYYQTDYEALAELFRQLALEACAGTVSVVKKVIPPGGTPADAQPTGGWTVSTADSGVTPSSGVTDDATGAVSFQVDLSGGPRPVTFSETVQAGYTLVQQGDSNATCTANGAATTTTNSGAAGFTVNAATNSIVSCVILNQAPTPIASVRVDKTWVVNGRSFPDPTQDPQFEAALQLTAEDDPAFGTEYGGFQAGQSVTVGEQVNTDLLPPGCSPVQASGDLGAQTLTAGLNTFTITNTVTCVTQLRLVKALDNPYGAPEPPLTAWTLNAFPPGSTDPVITGTTGVTGTVTPDAVYSLGESNVPGWTQTVNVGAVITPPATGSWDCNVLLPDGDPRGPGYDGSDGQVAVQIGQTAVCTAVNAAQPGRLTLRKQVDNPYGGAATPQDWLLRALPPTRNDLPPPPPVTGRSGEPAVTNALVYPNVPYALSETDGPEGYEQIGDVACVISGTETVVPTPNDLLTPTFGQDVTCTFANRQLPPPPAEARLTLRKQVDNQFGGTATPQDWLLNATPSPVSGATTISGRSGDGSVTDVEATPGVGYTLAETDGPDGYEQLGPVSCVLTGTDTPVATPDGVLTPDEGASYTCTWRNGQLDPGGAHLTLVKKVWHGKADPRDWTLTAAPRNGATPISASSGSPAVTDVRVQVGVGYALSESGGPKGYEEANPPECVLTGTDTRVPTADRVVTPETGQDITCTFHNRPKRHLPITGMKLTGFIAGGLLAVLGGAALLLLTWRRRRVA
ncbi:VWA domain-containing protein [Micromonospora sp. 067-2]|uniref:VWA domain-containing protein n=1 Tax=Micromonospora sp. 067-2 TaxID=2789270 RepID=UPI0039792106